MVVTASSTASARSCRRCHRSATWMARGGALCCAFGVAPAAVTASCRDDRSSTACKCSELGTWPGKACGCAACFISRTYRLHLGCTVLDCQRRAYRSLWPAEDQFTCNGGYVFTWRLALGLVIPHQLPIFGMQHLHPDRTWPLAVAGALPADSPSFRLFVVVAVLAVTAAGAAGVSRAELAEAGWLAALQLWFLPVYPPAASPCSASRCQPPHASASPAPSPRHFSPWPSPASASPTNRRTRAWPGAGQPGTAHGEPGQDRRADRRQANRAGGACRAVVLAPAPAPRRTAQWPQADTAAARCRRRADRRAATARACELRHLVLVPVTSRRPMPG